MIIRNQNVLITGGASGIGRIMGELALKKGARSLVIWDINQANIDASVKDLSRFGKVAGYRVDVSDSGAVETAYAQVKKDLGYVDILIQCAGIVTGNRTFEKNSVDE
ncbi:MAG: SDR family NAD(P)-dependent oxidoreductase, partial [Candidatus Cryptobacteroides sp.]